MKHEGYPEINGLAPIFGEGDKRSNNVDFIEGPDAAIAQNRTEVVILTLKEGKTKEDLAAVIAVLAPKITAEEGCAKPLAWGRPVKSLERLSSFSSDGKVPRWDVPQGPSIFCC
jgi:hypothetical protein